MCMGDMILRSPHSLPQVPQGGVRGPISEVWDGHSRFLILDSFLFRGHFEDQPLLIGVFSKYSTSGRTGDKGPFCVAGKWAGNKAAADPAELGVVGGRVSQGGRRGGRREGGRQ